MTLENFFHVLHGVQNNMKELLGYFLDEEDYSLYLKEVICYKGEEVPERVFGLKVAVGNPSGGTKDYLAYSHNNFEIPLGKYVPFNTDVKNLVYNHEDLLRYEIPSDISPGDGFDSYHAAIEHIRLMYFQVPQTGLYPHAQFVFPTHCGVENTDKARDLLDSLHQMNPQHISSMVDLTDQMLSVTI